MVFVWGLSLIVVFSSIHVNGSNNCIPIFIPIMILVFYIVIKIQIHKYVSYDNIFKT